RGHFRDRHAPGRLRRVRAGGPVPRQTPRAAARQRRRLHGAAGEGGCPGRQRGRDRLRRVVPGVQLLPDRGGAPSREPALPAEFGLLRAAGFRRGTVGLVLLAEGAILAAVGGLVGLAFAILYSRGLVAFLGAVWPGGALRSLLRPHVTLTSLLIGYGSSLLVS